MTKEIPRANLNHKVVLRKSKRAKYLQIKIDPTGDVNVVIPRGYTEKDGLQFLNQKESWVKEKLKKIDSTNKKYRYLGEEISITRQKSDFLLEIVPFFDGKELIVPSNVFNIREYYLEWLFKEAEDYIIPRVNLLGGINGFRFKSVSIKKLKSRWGSCSSSKRLSFNYKLMYFNTKIIDYVIIHELCHLEEMNHSKNFWQLVESIMPEYRTLKKQLIYV